ncbi:hypothetical protein L208DRAFT_1241065 [Tricholoma matsutake]|nr:hypothetical protein L208DRAFT_1241065 [Tricholoma matsutake 945]
MLVPTRSCLRLLHTSSRICSHLTAPPDPISHMRPVIYDDVPPPSSSSLLHHPYSLSEFMTGSQDQRGQLELQFKLERQQLDAFHQNFWLDTNARFEAAKEAVLASLPSSFTVIDKEKALSEFHKQWCMQEAPRTDDYTKEWRKRNLSLILLGVRVEYQKLAIRISDLVSPKRSNT